MLESRNVCMNSVMICGIDVALWKVGWQFFVKQLYRMYALRALGCLSLHRSMVFWDLVSEVSGQKWAILGICLVFLGSTLKKFRFETYLLAGIFFYFHLFLTGKSAWGGHAMYYSYYSSFETLYKFIHNTILLKKL